MVSKYLAVTTCALALAFATGCPSDDSETAGDGGSGGGSSGAGGGGGAKVTPEEALAGGCDSGGGSGNGSADCTGIAEYTACADDCGMQDCFDGACADYLACVSGADDPCDAMGSTCSPSSDCQSCLSTAGQCIVSNKCTELLSCGERVEGGACDRVDACCASLDAFQKMACDLTAGSVKSTGDANCQMLLEGYGCE